MVTTTRVFSVAVREWVLLWMDRGTLHKMDKTERRSPSSSVSPNGGHQQKMTLNQEVLKSDGTSGTHVTIPRGIPYPQAVEIPVHLPLISLLSTYITVESYGGLVLT